jgi:predicted amidohydrolase
VDNLVREAVRAGAQYVQTPEMTNIIQRDRAALAASIAPEASDRAVARFAALARELGVVLHIGSLALKAADGRIANRALVFGRGGHVLARYDKIHLFDVDLPNGESWRESAVYHPGDRAVVVDLPWLKLGLSICYDIRFPQLYRAEAHAGAAALTAPAAFTRQTGEAHWHVLQRARAIENGAFVISAAQAGKHADGRQTFGHSIIVAPWGEVLAEAGGEGPEIISAEIDPAKSADARARIPALKNERPFAPPDAVEPIPMRSAS